MARFLTLILLIFTLSGTMAGNTENLVASKLSEIIIPGFASTQLRAWSVLDCPYSPLDFNPLDSVWLDTTRVISAVNCWLKCMMLNPYNQTDHPECKSRPDSGLSATTELNPGCITGNYSVDEKEIPTTHMYVMRWSTEPTILAGQQIFVNIEVPNAQGGNSYPSMADVAQDLTSSIECGRPVCLPFSAREIYDGTLFKAIEDYDPDSKRLLHQLQKYYQRDPVLNPLTPWDRPPIKNVFCIYRVDSKTEVGYYFAPSGKPYPDNWIVTYHL